MTNLIPAEVFPPGEFLKEELEARGWTQADLAEILGRPPRLISEIISGKRAISPETAQGLGAAFGVDPQYWLNLESAYQLSRIGEPNAAIAKRAQLFARLPVKELIRRHWIQPSENADMLESNLKTFLGVDSLDQAPAIYPHASRKSSSYAEVTPAQWAWLARARQLARYVSAQPYVEARFAEMMAQLKVLLSSPEEIRRVPQMLAEYGIRLVIIEPLSGTKLDGACFWLNPQSPVIVLSLRYDRIDAFWFTLFHELGHVKAGDGLHTDAIPVDENLVGQNAVRSEEKHEQAADRFATASIISPTKLNSFITRIGPLYSKEKIQGFAVVQGVHPGLVVGQLQHLEEITYAHNREMLVRVRDLAIRTALTDGWGATPMVQ